LHSKNRNLRIFAGISLLNLLIATGLLVGAQTPTPPPGDVNATAEALLRMGELYMVTPHPFLGAEYFSEALALAPDNTDFYLRAARSHPDARSQLSYIGLGLLHLPDEGRLHLAAGHSLFSIYADEWQFERQSEFETPEDALDDALLKYAIAQALGAADVRLYTNLALLEEEQDKWAYAAALYTAALESTTDRFAPVVLYWRRGQAYLMLEDAGAAEADARASIAIDGDYAPVWLLLGKALEMKGEIAGAVDAYRQYVVYAEWQSGGPDAHAVEFLEAHGEIEP
jgi:tetratricopeptide (TPR) repeat protein